jgi:hypothetical protein
VTVLLHSAGKQFANLLLTVGLISSAAQVKAATDWSLPVTGNLLGTVMDGAGEPQMGASVELLNKYNRLISKTLSSPDGRFAFAGLASDVYSVRVSLTSFLPAFRDRILVKAGANSMLQIHLSTLFSNIQLGTTIPTGGMTNDWKWVLRSSPSTRPITRFLPDDTNVAAVKPQVFSGTHMMVGMSGGSSGLVDAGSVDSGTRFALSTNLFGKNQIQVAGSLGQGMDLGGNAFSICAVYSRDSGLGFANAPEITLTVSQVSLLPSQNGTAGLLKTMAMSVYEVADPLEGVHVEYGMTGEAVDYLQHTSRISPFARISVDTGKLGTLVAAFSDGGRPDELTAHQSFRQAAAGQDAEDDLTSSLNAVARTPQVSTRQDRLQLQRTENFELGLDKTSGSRTYAFSAFYEEVSNGRLNVAGDLTSLVSGDVLSDGISRTSTYNIGNYQRNGYMASVRQKLSDTLDFDLGYGRMGGFSAKQEVLSGTVSPAGFLQNGNHGMASAALNTRIAMSGTRLTAQYGWTDPGAAIPQHVFTTQGGYMSPGLNIYFRQPLPSFFGMPGRLELTGDLRNLLSDGYLPLQNVDGRKLLIVEAPKAIRGGVSFTF